MLQICLPASEGIWENSHVSPRASYNFRQCVRKRGSSLFYKWVLEIIFLEFSTLCLLLIGLKIWQFKSYNRKDNPSTNSSNTNIYLNARTQQQHLKQQQQQQQQQQRCIRPILCISVFGVEKKFKFLYFISVIRCLSFLILCFRWLITILQIYLLVNLTLEKFFTTLCLMLGYFLTTIY